ncbi:hypothetical protein TVAG_349930 [Trichomonas vaginalis G3]|uniref:Uncharacterized protein n=1 Tax=Trichomonas vaginalis (strain ATCC PRA-98 / G3) TaxID=412133 RepID=A2FR16_TRIV3|nr:hypothetical protein TVAGG3_0415890 [Trichomonas vaginalis G3]EAX92646.1 hypothetical protein TVAG_349930 [Trichomonas vaginalis G3]KAI5535696.1 hypothetical protein TVAGG3_0415890 [Trichomonas vaginalis G3]|eukprot:XP_001305576.1 hypothetical protein [Trichomonas vaginalis G3]
MGNEESMSSSQSIGLPASAPTQTSSVLTELQESEKECIEKSQKVITDYETYFQKRGSNLIEDFNNNLRFDPPMFDLERKLIENTYIDYRPLQSDIHTRLKRYKNRSLYAHGIEVQEKEQTYKLYVKAFIENDKYELDVQVNSKMQRLMLLKKQNAELKEKIEKIKARILESSV